MDAVQQEEAIDSLASLELRVARAVELLSSLRSENESLRQQLTAVQAEREQAITRSSTLRDELAAAQMEIKRHDQELDDLRSERKQVKSRIEKLLGQMDLLSNA
jgi:chromosome segregation ATPase